MIELNFQQGDETWKKLRRRCFTDPYWFTESVLGLVDLFPIAPETHALPILFAYRKTGIPDIDHAPYQLLMWPRETGKSTAITEGRTINWSCKNPNTATLIANEKQDTAADFIGTIKHHFESNDVLRALFPEVLPDPNKTVWSATRASLKRQTGRPEPTFDCIGVGGTVTGKHYDTIIGDDLISREAMENARAGNWTIMHKVNRWVNQLPPLLSNSAEPFPQITFIGTHWWHDDVYKHIQKVFGRNQEPRRYRIKARLPNGKTVSRDVWRQGNLAVMIISAVENAKPVFPAIWPQERIDEVLEADPEFAACNLFNDPSNAAVRTFDDDWLRYWQYVTGDSGTIAYKAEDGTTKFVSVGELFKVIAVDPAASSNMEGARNAIVVLGTDMTNGKQLVLDVHADHSDPKDLVVDIVNMAQKWGVHQAYIELAGQQLYVQQWVEKESRQRNYPLAVESLKPGGRNKDLRIGGLVIPFKNGDLYVHVSQTQLIVEEYRHYRPGAKHRDVLDALAYAVEVAPKPLGGTRGTSAKKRAQEQLDSYRRRLRGSIHAAH